VVTHIKPAVTRHERPADGNTTDGEPTWEFKTTTTSVASREAVKEVDLTLNENATLNNDVTKENEQQIVSHLPNDKEDKGDGNEKENEI